MIQRFGFSLSIGNIFSFGLLDEKFLLDSLCSSCLKGMLDLILTIEVFAVSGIIWMSVFELILLDGSTEIRIECLKAVCQREFRIDGYLTCFFEQLLCCLRMNDFVASRKRKKPKTLGLSWRFIRFIIRL